MRNLMRAFVFAACASLTLAACAETSTSAPGVTRVVSTTSFGMCVGYCRTHLELSAQGAVLVREGHSGRGNSGDKLPDQRFTRPFNAAEWAEISALAAKANIEALPERIGCPDCADGGAESLTIEGPGRNKTITFEHGATIEQAQALIERVRAIRQELAPKE